MRSKRLLALLGTVAIVLSLVLSGCTAGDQYPEALYLSDVYSHGVLLTAGGGGGGGEPGVNVETLVGDKTLVAGVDKIYQYLNCGAASRIVTLDTAAASEGDRFVIRNTTVYTSSLYLNLKQGATTLDYFYSGKIVSVVFDGTNWLTEDNASSDSSALRSNTAIGYLSRGYSGGVAVGYNSQGYNYGAAVGYSASSNGKYYSSALGYRSEAERYSEVAFNIGSETDQENNRTIGGFEGQTTSGAATEIFCGAANQRFTIRASSVLAFTLIITARDNTANEVARYSVSDGLIKRDGSNNTTMVLCTVNTDYEDDATWGVTVTADDTNEALIITVTGDGTNTVQWVAMLTGVETHF